MGILAKENQHSADLQSTMFTLRNKLRKKAINPPNQRDVLRDLKNSKHFYGVQIGQCGCKASSKYAGRFFKFKNVPSLPVAGCDAPECKCVYLGVSNRRSNMDRRSSIGLDLKDKRRKIFDRRKGKDVWKGVDE